jgi:hypothetical protein
MNNRPLSNGDVCIVTNGLARDKSPNIGKIVTIDKRVFGDFGMDHAQFGAIYSCIGNDLLLLNDAGGYTSTSKLDIAGIWLQRINPPKLAKQLEKVLELEK